MTSIVCGIQEIDGAIQQTIGGDLDHIGILNDAIADAKKDVTTRIEQSESTERDLDNCYKLEQTVLKQMKNDFVSKQALSKSD